MYDARLPKWKQRDKHSSTKEVTKLRWHVGLKQRDQIEGAGHQPASGGFQISPSGLRPLGAGPALRRAKTALLLVA